MYIYVCVCMYMYTPFSISTCRAATSRVLRGVRAAWLMGPGLYVYLYIYMYVNIYIYIHTYNTHTHTHTHTHTVLFHFYMQGGNVAECLGAYAQPNGTGSICILV